MKNIILTATLLVFMSLISCSNVSQQTNSANASTTGTLPDNGATKPAENENLTPASETAPGEVIQMSKTLFIEKVYDFESNPSAWTFKSDKPCIIDFYADWCRPCKMVAPIMDDLAKKYAGKVTFYKVNTDKEPELSRFFGISSIPTMLFCPVGENPQMTKGALPAETYEKVINELLLKSK